MADDVGPDMGLVESTRKFIDCTVDKIDDEKFILVTRVLVDYAGTGADVAGGREVTLGSAPSITGEGTPSIIRPLPPDDNGDPDNHEFILSIGLRIQYDREE